MRTAERILLIAFIFQACFAFAASAENGETVISRPVIEYNSGDLRDPFNDLLQAAIEKERKEKEAQSVQMSQEVVNVEEKVMPSLDKFKVQGVIWGGKFPQAIINNKILGVGDSIEGVKIASIENNHVVLSFSGRLFSLPAPGISADSKKENKEEK